MKITCSTSWEPRQGGEEQSSKKKKKNEANLNGVTTQRYNYYCIYTLRYSTNEPIFVRIKLDQS